MMHNFRKVSINSLIILVLISVLSICVIATDSYESDDNYTTANWILTDETIQGHTIDPAGDADYMKFNATAGAKYIIQTLDLRNDTDTILTLYQQNGITQIDQNDDLENGVLRRSKITWTATGTGTYFIKVHDWNASHGGGIYNISVQEIPIVRMTLVDYSTNVQKGQPFNVSVNVSCQGIACNGMEVFLDPEPAKKEKNELNLNILESIEELPDEEFDVIIVLKEPEGQELKSKGFSVQAKESKSESKKALNARADAVKNKQDSVLSTLGVSQSKRMKSMGSSSSKFTLKQKYNVINAISGRVTKEGLEALKNDPDVESVELERQYSALLDNSTGNIGAPQVWATQLNGINITGTGQTICILDTGIAYSHPDFGGYGTFPNAKVIAGYDFVNDDNDPADDHGHGSHCAGIAASENDTYRGVAPGARLVAGKVLDSGGNGISSDIIAGIDYCIAHSDEFNITVISMSLGCDGACTHYQTYCTGAMATAIDYAANLGIAIPIASGNGGWTDGVADPSCAEGAITVGSVDKSDVAAASSNMGTLVDVMAPGVSITATQHDGTHESMSGTSMATPHVAGAAALLNQYYHLNDGLMYHVDAIKDALTSTGLDVSDHGYTKPRINVYEALSEPLPKGIISTTAGATPFYTTSANPNITTLSAGSSHIVTWTVNATGDFGTYAFFAFVDIEDGNETESDSVNITIFDQTYPIISLESPADSHATNDPDVSFVFNVTDSLDTSFNCSLYINGQFNETNASVSRGISTTFSKTLSEGAYSWNISCNDSYGNLNWSETRTMNVDTTYPQFFNSTYSPENYSAYSSTQAYMFNITFNDSLRMDNVLMEFDGVNYSVSNISDVYMFNISNLGAGSYQYRWFGNDSAGNSNSTAMTYYDIAKASSEVDLLLSGDDSNKTVNVSSEVNISGSLVTGTGNLYLYDNSVLMNNGTSPLSNLTSYSSEGTHNITVVYSTTQNYSSSSETHWLIVQDLASPTVTLTSPGNNNWTNSTNLTLRYNVTDAAEGIDNCSLYFDNALNQTDTSVTEGADEFNVTAAAGSHTWYVSCIDNASQHNAGTSATWTVKIAAQTIEADASFQNSTNGTTTKNYSTQSSTLLQISVNTTVVGNVTVTRYGLQPERVNSTLSNGVKYVDVTLSSNVRDVLEWILIKVYYDDSEVSGLDESTLNMQWYNETSNTWTALTAGSPSWVNSVGVDTTDNYVWANVSHLSIYGLTGSTTSTPTTTGGGGGGGGSSTSGTIQVVPTYDTKLAEIMKNNKLNIVYDGAVYSFTVSQVSADLVKLKKDNYYYTIYAGDSDVVGLKELFSNDVVIGMENQSYDESTKKAIISITLYQEPVVSRPSALPVKKEEPVQEIEEVSAEDKVEAPKLTGNGVNDVSEIVEPIEENPSLVWRNTRYVLGFALVFMMIAVLVVLSVMRLRRIRRNNNLMKRKLKDFEKELEAQLERKNKSI